MIRLWLAVMPQAIAGLVLLALPVTEPVPTVSSVLGGILLLVGAFCASSLYRPEDP